MNANIGFLGLGRMGGAMAERLLVDGWRLHVYDSAPEAMAPFIARGAVAHASPRAVADEAEVVIACLPHLEACEAVLFAPDGVARGKAVKTYVETSTIGPEAVAALAGRLGEAGIGLVDAPVTGGPMVAKAGNLTIMLSGARDHVDRSLPGLGRIAGKLCVLGDRAGQGQLMKLINNLVMATNMVVASEGLILGAKAGLDAGQMFEVLKAGSGASFSAGILAETVLDRSFDFGAHMTIITKDMGLGLRQAAAYDTPARTMTAAADIWNQASAAMGADVDFSRLICLFEERAGVRLER
ncbi:MAG: NAD(P)-dependent oxidoreductase [Sphingobium sp.]